MSLRRASERCVCVCVCVCVCACACVCVWGGGGGGVYVRASVSACVRKCMCIFHISIVDVYIMLAFIQIVGNFLHLEVHYTCYILLVRRFDLQGIRLTNVHYY